MLKLSQQKERSIRGKYAEDKVRDELKRESDRRAEFDFERNYDARSSMGRIPRRAGDFTFYEKYVNLAGSSATGHGVVEVKQVAHDFRLPKKNFNPDKFGVLRKRQLAGGVVAVIIYHATTKKWREVPFYWFDERRDQASWDLSQFPEHATAREALMRAGVVEG